VGYLVLLIRMVDNQRVPKIGPVYHGKECSVANTNESMQNHSSCSRESCGSTDGKTVKKYLSGVKKPGKYLLTYFSNGSVFICEHKMRSV
ncbi:MAG: hypothetical protein PVF49_09415, partial [Anaerolineales bacterium]